MYIIYLFFGGIMILNDFPIHIVPNIYRALIDAMETSEVVCHDFKKNNVDNAYYPNLWSNIYLNLFNSFESYNMKSYLWKYVSCYFEDTKSVVTFMRKKKFTNIMKNHKHISMYQQAYTYFNKDLDTQLELFEYIEDDKVVEKNNEIKNIIAKNIDNHILIIFDYLNRDVNFLSAYILAPSGEVIDELNLLDYIDPQIRPIETDLLDNVPTRPENYEPIVGIKDKYLKSNDKGNSK